MISYTPDGDYASNEKLDMKGLNGRRPQIASSSQYKIVNGKLKKERNHLLRASFSNNIQREQSDIHSKRPFSQERKLTQNRLGANQKQSNTGCRNSNNYNEGHLSESSRVMSASGKRYPKMPKKRGNKIIFLNETNEISMSQADLNAL